jgi:hypothetical protein
MYVRKTEDVYYLETDYGYGKELEVGYDTWKEAEQGKRNIWTIART